MGQWRERHGDGGFEVNSIGKFQELTEERRGEGEELTEDNSRQKQLEASG
jgi:hypothetical protein